jgi:general secretion pathway protein N
MRVSWNTLNLARQGQQVDLRGQTTVELNDIGSALSSIKPLGSYKLTMQWEGQQAQLNLETVKGALLLSGKGRLAGGQFEFSGNAARGEEERLANLLNLLGQRRQEGDKTIIALEFRQ